MTTILDQLDDMIILDPAEGAAAFRRDAETIARRLKGYRDQVASLTVALQRAARNERRAVTVRAQSRNAGLVASAKGHLANLATLIAEDEKWAVEYLVWAVEMEDGGR
ncbi:hypothetical protein ACWDRR_24195 [Kitasatospora sp. NPDC003701]